MFIMLSYMAMKRSLNKGIFSLVIFIDLVTDMKSTITVCRSDKSINQIIIYFEVFF